MFTECIAGSILTLHARVYRTASPSPLRYFREDLGIDDTKVMKDIHDVIIKTLLCIESHVIGQVGGHWGSEYNMSCVRACVRVCMYVLEYVGAEWQVSCGTFFLSVSYRFHF